MTLKLYTVAIETEIVVLANSPGEAEEQAANAQSDLSESDYGIHARNMSHLPAEWEMDSIPFGEKDDDDPDRTLGEWIERGAAPEYKR